MQSDMLRFVVCGSVDDGKSTLLGRLLYDAKLLLQDTISNLASVSFARGNSELDLSLITDGLQDERQQGITIDVAYRYFSTGSRKFISADAPGHSQYTRNMVTGCSTADLAIVLVDVIKGITPQTLRHLNICEMLRVPNIVVAINKMDLVDDSVKYLKIKHQLEEVYKTLPISFVPTSGITGNMVVNRMPSLSWYAGPTILELLMSTPVRRFDGVDLRVPIQLVSYDNDKQYCAGKVVSGTLVEGMQVCILPEKVYTTISKVYDVNNEVSHGSNALFEVQSGTVSRGNLLVGTNSCIKCGSSINAKVCWFSETPAVNKQTVLIRHATSEYVAQLELGEISSLAMNGIENVTLKFSNLIYYDQYDSNKELGSFVILDINNFNTIGAGVIMKDTNATDSY